MSVDLFKKKYLKAEALALVRQSVTDPKLLDDAIKKYHMYLDINPSDDEAWAGLGGAYRRKGRIDEALDSYCRAYQINQQSTYALVNVVSLRAARNSAEDQAKLATEIPEAILLCQQDIKKDTEDFWTWYDLATLLLIQGKTSEAISNFNYAIGLTPQTAKENFRSVLNNLNFLHKHNPSIKGMQTVIEMINQHLTQS